MPRRLTLNTSILIAAAAGVAGGLALGAYGPATPFGTGLLYAATLAGNLFIDLLKMVVVPLVFACLVCGVAGLGAHRELGGVWRWTLAFFLTSMLVAIVIGLTAANVFRPGAGLHLAMFADATAHFQAHQLPLGDYVAHVLHGLFQNPFAALASGDILAVVMVALLFGIALAAGAYRYPYLCGAMAELQSLMLVMVGWIMWLAPLGVGALLLRLVATQDSGLLVGLLHFTVVVIGAPGIPSIGMVSMVLVLQSVGLPTEAITLLLPIDRILDTVRTAVNVQDDMIGSLIVQRLALGRPEVAVTKWEYPRGNDIDRDRPVTPTRRPATTAPTPRSAPRPPHAARSAAGDARRASPRAPPVVRRWAGRGSSPVRPSPPRSPSAGPGR